MISEYLTRRTAAPTLLRHKTEFRFLTIAGTLDTLNAIGTLKEDRIEEGLDNSPILSKIEEGLTGLTHGCIFFQEILIFPQSRALTSSHLVQVQF